jgi:dUTP pyrophosphatase
LKVKNKEEMENKFLKVKKTCENAVIPTRGTPFSVGYDLTVIGVFKKIDDKTVLYDTGLQVEPPEGYYTEILPRSSLVKTGYMLSNSVGVIDSDYRGNLLIALTKVNQEPTRFRGSFYKMSTCTKKIRRF